MQSDLPFFESPEDALRSAIQSLGGTKKVGNLLWPDKTIENASRLLHDCINPNRPEKLDVSQVVFIFKSAKEVGCGSPFVWFANECGFDAFPINNEELADRLTDVIEQSTQTLAKALDQLSKIKGMKK